MWLVRYVNVSREMDSNLNISPKMSCGVLECDSVMLQSDDYDFAIKIKIGGVICAGPLSMSCL